MEVASGVERVVIASSSGGSSLVKRLPGVERPSHPGRGRQGQRRGAGRPPSGRARLAERAQGRPEVTTDWMDASVIDETDPTQDDTSSTRSSLRTDRPTRPAFIDRYRAAQRARNQRITDWATAELPAGQRRQRARHPVSRSSRTLGRPAVRGQRSVIRSAHPAPAAIAASRRTCQQTRPGIERANSLLDTAFDGGAWRPPGTRAASSQPRSAYAGAGVVQSHRRHGRLPQRRAGRLRGAGFDEDKTLELIPGASRKPTNGKAGQARGRPDFSLDHGAKLALAAHPGAERAARAGSPDGSLIQAALLLRRPAIGRADFEVEHVVFHAGSSAAPPRPAGRAPRAWCRSRRGRSTALAGQPVH